MSTKDEVIELIRRLPEDVSLADIVAELYFRQKVGAGLEELDAGKGIPHVQVKEQLKQWLS